MLDQITAAVFLSSVLFLVIHLGVGISRGGVF